MNYKMSELKQCLRGYFKKRPEIEVAYVFGSVSQQRTNALSDIDIAVLLNEKKISTKAYPYGYKADLLADLMKILKTNKIDVVVLNETPPLLRHRILYFGKLLYSSNERKRIDFQTETIDKYNDYKQLTAVHLERRR